MPWMIYLVSAVLGYLLGSFPTGYLVGRRYQLVPQLDGTIRPRLLPLRGPQGIDIRQHGSGNIGATNVVRVLGKRPGYLVFFCDAMKGLLAVRLAIWWCGRAAISASGMLALDSARIGLALSPKPLESYVALQGAEVHVVGIVTIAGIIAGLACILGHNFPVWLRFRGGKGVATTIGVLLGLMPVAFAISAGVWIISFFVMRYVSLASLLAAASLPIIVWRLTGPGTPMFWFAVVAAALIFLRHRANISRLLAGTEPRFVRKKT